MAIRFSPGPCGCCNKKVLFWINESYYFKTITSTPGILASIYYRNLNLTVNSYIQELDQINPLINNNTTEKYSGDINDYKLVFWCFPTVQGTTLPSWFNTVKTGGFNNGRIIIIIDWFFYLMSDVLNWSTIMSQLGIGIQLNPNSFYSTPSTQKVLIGPQFTVEADKLNKNISKFNVFADAAAELLIGNGVSLSKGEVYTNGLSSGAKSDWLAKTPNIQGVTDFVISGNKGFIDDPNNNQFLNNLYYID